MSNVRVLIVYYSRKGHTEKMAQWVAEGAREVPEAEVVVKKVVDATLEDALEADGIIFGSPVYNATIAAELKAYLDLLCELHGRLQTKVGGAFTSAAWADGGNSFAILSLWGFMGLENMIIVPEGVGRFSSAGCEELPELDPLNNSEIVRARCKDVGRRVTQVAKILKGKIPTHMFRTPYGRTTKEENWLIGVGAPWPLPLPPNLKKTIKEYLSTTLS